MNLVHNPAFPGIYIDVDAMEERYRREQLEYQQRLEESRKRDAAEVSICVSSKCPLLSSRKGEPEWCLNGNAHLACRRIYNTVQKRSYVVACEYAEKRKDK